MGIEYHYQLIQGSDEWKQARLGLITASEMKLLVTPAKLEVANNDKERTHCFELAAQRINNYVEPHYESDDMERGTLDEIDARNLYRKAYTADGQVMEVGFVTNDKWGFKMGYSPDALVGDYGQWECKSRMQKHQMATIVTGEMPVEYMIQVQTGLLITGREWCDFSTFCGGMPMMTLRIKRDQVMQQKILAAASAFEAKIQNMIKVYESKLQNPDLRFLPTERRATEEDIY